MERWAVPKGTAGPARRSGAAQPSFSSTLLDAIYKSMDEPGHGDAGVWGGWQQLRLLPPLRSSTRPCTMVTTTSRRWRGATGRARRARTPRRRARRSVPAMVGSRRPRRSRRTTDASAPSVRLYPVGRRRPRRRRRPRNRGHPSGPSSGTSASRLPPARAWPASSTPSSPGNARRPRRPRPRPVASPRARRRRPTPAPA
uniref:Uncharacterized protein n=1 Tax=Oryza brachyantha TaxID=4533 RepID=J3LKJ5_ORYBR